MDREEAIKRVKALNLNSKDMEALSTLVPEIVESEDERIRKGLIKAFGSIGKKEWGGINVKNAIAWIEKQGKKIDAIENFDTEFERQISHLIASAINKEHEYNQGYVKWVANGLLEYAKHELEKQGERRPANKVASNLLTHERAMEISPFMRSGFENEDKVEPKFHKEDWVVWDNKISCHVDNIYQGKNSLMYTITDTNNMTRSYSVKGFDNNAHLWTIQDAKDGDLIYSRHNTESFEWIGIYKSLDKENKRVFFYGFWHDMAKTFSVCGNEAYVLYDDFSPATKEQRDTLEKAMADAGWEFDFDKKELKKIEEEVNGEDYGIDSLYHAQRILEKTLGKVDGYQTDDGILSHQCAITAVKKLYEQNPSWSEEDDNCLSTIIAEFSKCSGKSVSKDEWMRCNDFLNSLKDRCTWKPSEEQMMYLSEAIDVVTKAEKFSIATALKELIEQIKK